MAARNVARMGVALARRPDLWSAAAGVGLRLVPDRWWVRGPWPSRAYLDYRAKAVYGDQASNLPPEDLIRYLEWCKAFPGPVH